MGLPRLWNPLAVIHYSKITNLRSYLRARKLPQGFLDGLITIHRFGKYSLANNFYVTPLTLARNMIVELSLQSY